MKTVKELLKSIPDRGIRKKALLNLDPRRANDPATSQSNALSKAFFYHESPEGLSFWSDVHFKLLQNEQKAL